MEFATPRPTFTAPGDPNVFRPHPAIRAIGYVAIGLIALIVVCTALLALIAETKPESGLFWMITVVFVLMAAALHRMTFHPMVRIEGDGVRVRNLLSEQLLEWHDIAGVKPGYWGL